MPELLEELLVRCRGGDHAAVEFLVRRFRRYGMDLATHILGDRHLAEDAVQEAFVSVLQRLPELRTPSAFPGWFRQIVRTHAVRLARRRGEGAATCRPDPEAPAVDMDLDDARRLIRRGLATLSDKNRDAATLFYLNDLDIHEVARALGVPTGTVKRRLHDARRRLRDTLPL